MNYLLLGVFTFAFAVIVAYAFTGGNAVMQSLIRTTALVVALTLYTLSAATRDYDLTFLYPLLVGAIFVLIVFTLIQIVFPMGRTSMTIYVCLASIVACGSIVYDTDYLIKQHTYDEYIWAAVSLYADIFGLFLLFLIFRFADWGEED